MRGYLVLGPESSGTKLLTKLLIGAGCAGDDGDVQRWDTQPFEGNLVVWRRSVPHGGEWPDLAKCIRRMESQGYEVRILVTSRNWHAVMNSQVKTGHVQRPAQAVENIRGAYRCIFGAILYSMVQFEIVNYESLIRPGSGTVPRLMESLGLRLDAPTYLYDGNKKWGV